MAGQAKERNKRTKVVLQRILGIHPVKKANLQRKDTKLYDIEVKEVDKANKRLKIHYVGYSSRFNEWDLSGTMKDLNISRLFVKKSCLFHRKIPLWIEHKHFTINFFMKWRKSLLWAARGPWNQHRPQCWSGCFYGRSRKCFAWHYPKRKNGLPSKVK